MVPLQVRPVLWVRVEFQDPGGTEEIPVRSFQMDPLLENLENQGVLDLEDRRENQGVQVPKSSCSPAV